MSAAGASVPRMDRRADRGAAGDDLAAAWYTDRGFHVAERNWRCPAGELDLVAVRDGVLVICEVKTRSGRAFGAGYEAVGWQKQRKLRQLAELFLLGSAVRPAAVRFDVASVSLTTGGASLELFEDAY